MTSYTNIPHSSEERTYSTIKPQGTQYNMKPHAHIFKSRVPRVVRIGTLPLGLVSFDRITFTSGMTNRLIS